MILASRGRHGSGDAGTAPSIYSSQNYVSPSNIPEYYITLPSGVTPGDLLVCFFQTAIGTAPDPAAGWTMLPGTYAGYAGLTSIFYRIATGSDALTVTLNYPLGAAARATTIAISNADTIEGTEYAFVSGYNSDIDPPSHTPTGVGKYFLYLATESNGGASPALAAPSGFTNLITRAGVDGNDLSFGLATKATLDSPVNPGIFTMSTQHTYWVAWTLAAYKA